MRFRKLLTIAAAASMALSTALLSPAGADTKDNVDVYATEGEHYVNGREWRTECEPYSQTERCRTEIMATVVKVKDGRFYQEQDWTFNNLTYKPSARALWKDNPLGHTGKWVAEDGRQWRTECDTDLTGRNGCRSFVVATILESYINDDCVRSFRQVNKEVFNNMVRFTVSGETPDPSPSPEPTDPTTPPVDEVEITNPTVEECIRVEAGLGADEPILQTDLDGITEFSCVELGVTDISDIAKLTNLEVLDLSGNEIVDLAPLSDLDGLVDLTLDGNQIADVSALAGLENLDRLSIAGNQIVDLAGIEGLTGLTFLDASENLIVDLSELSALLDLRVLNLYGNEIVEVTALADLTDLTNLDLGSNNILKVDALVDLTSLEILDLSDNEIALVDRLVLEVLELLGVVIIW